MTKAGLDHPLGSSLGYPSPILTALSTPLTRTRQTSPADENDAEVMEEEERRVRNWSYVI